MNNEINNLPLLGKSAIFFGLTLYCTFCGGLLAIEGVVILQAKNNKKIINYYNCHTY